MKTPTYVERTEALIKGDNAKEIAGKNQKKLVAGIDSQIAQKAAARLELEQKLDDAKENLEKSLVKSVLITNAPAVIQDYLNAQIAVDEAEEALTNHDFTVELLVKGKELLK